MVKIRLLTVFTLMLMAAANLPAQKVGDDVLYQCFCLGQEWVRAKVVEESYLKVRIRWGNLDNQVIVIDKNSPKLKWNFPNPGETVPPNAMQQAFMREAGKYMGAVGSFAQLVDPAIKNVRVGAGVPDSAQWQRTMMLLAELDDLCKTRYRGITDYRGATYARDPAVLDYRYGLWCQIAADRDALEKRARVAVAGTLINLGYTDENLRYGFNEPDNPVRWETQQLIWERDKWRAEKIAWLRPKYAVYKVAVPADATAEAEKKADELKAIVLRDAPNRSYKQPPWRDAAVEAVVRSALAKEYPGVQVLKIGLDYRTWVKRRSLDYVASDDLFRYYRVSYNSYKRGTVLLKIPNRPLCQMQDFVVGLNGGKVVPAGVGGSGTFMRCE